jgi:hypothetical protein
MNYKQVLRYQPELRFTNKNNISVRMLNLSNEDLFVAYNVIKCNYELHSVENYKINGISYNVTLEPEMVNGFLFNDYKANNLKMFVNEVQDRREKTNYRLEQAEENRFNQVNSLDIIERTIGTKV